MYRRHYTFIYEARNHKIFICDDVSALFERREATAEVGDFQCYFYILYQKKWQ